MPFQSSYDLARYLKEFLSTAREVGFSLEEIGKIFEDNSNFREDLLQRVLEIDQAKGLALIQSLAQSDDKNIRVLLAKWIVPNPKLPSDTITELRSIFTEDACPSVRSAVAYPLGIDDYPKNKPIPPVEVLERLSKDRVWFVRWGVATNPNTPPATLEDLAYDDHDSVRSSVFSNKNTPSHIKEKLEQVRDKLYTSSFGKISRPST